MLAKVQTCALVGVDALPVQVEVRAGSAQKEKFTVIGLGDIAVREARDRVGSSLKHAGFALPDLVLVNLAPAEVRKEGAAFDLPIAIAILVASGQLGGEVLEGVSLHGELSLDGSVRPVRGMVALAIEALRHGARLLVVPAANAAEARLIQGLEIVPVSSLAEVVAFLKGAWQPPAEADAVRPEAAVHRPPPHGALSDVWGQERAKRAMLIAAAGGHNLLMIGPPGCGKSMLAERFRSLLPRLRDQEVLEAVKLHSIAGLPVHGLLQGLRPFRNPHHTTSDAGLVGGGAVPGPGEISLAHGGVLFLDEFPEFRRSVLETLRGPLESGTVSVSRAKARVTFPARFLLIAAMNPCPCGKLGSAQRCLCSPFAIQAYLRKLSQPILDRIDLHVELEAVPFTLLGREQAPDAGEAQQRWRQQVLVAHEQQFARQGRRNSDLESSEVIRRVRLPAEAVRLLEAAATRFGFSARTYVRLLRVARTIADLAGEDQPRAAHIAEAISFRSLERLGAACALAGVGGPASRV